MDEDHDEGTAESTVEGEGLLPVNCDGGAVDCL